jgi:uncharacterized protein involved in response to NO
VAANAVWVAFFWAAVVLAVIPGFALGGALFLFPSGSWSGAAARAHGQVELFGWAGLMVLGVGFHFLPRLRGKALAHAEHAPTVLILLVAGLILRLISDPLLSVVGTTDRPGLLARAGLVLSGALELAGTSLAVVLLALTLCGKPAVSSRPGLIQVLPLLGVAFAGFWLATLANLVSTIAQASGSTATASAFDNMTTLLALYLFLVPISAGIGARVFPLHFAARPPQPRLLQAGLILLVVGLAVRLVTNAAGQGTLASVARLLLAAGLVLFVFGLRVFGRRRDVPGERRAWYADAAQWHGLTAAAWLALDALLLVLSALALLPIRFDVERHVVGAGFVTLLILGEGVNLLPGFARRPLRGQALVWFTLIVGNLAALLRVGPLLAPVVFGSTGVQGALAGAGLAGLIAVVAFARNVGPPLRAT